MFSTNFNILRRFDGKMYDFFSIIEEGDIFADIVSFFDVSKINGSAVDFDPRKYGDEFDWYFKRWFISESMNNDGFVDG